jgi:hypothetical protein
MNDYTVKMINGEEKRIICDGYHTQENDHLINFYNSTEKRFFVDTIIQFPLTSVLWIMDDKNKKYVSS